MRQHSMKLFLQNNCDHRNTKSAADLLHNPGGAAGMGNLPGSQAHIG